MAGSNAIDGDMDTRWESAHGVDPSWLVIDLQAQQSLGRIVINWEAANAADYLIQGSNDNNNWTTLATQTGGTFGARTDTVSISGSYRYLRIYGTARSVGNNWGYSIYEVAVYATQAEPTTGSCIGNCQQSIATS